MSGWEVRFADQFDGRGADPAVLDALWTERADWFDRHPCSKALGFKCAPKVPVHRGMGSGVEQWRGLVGQHFSDVNRALCIMGYESGGNPNAYNSSSGASGLLQIMGFWADSLGIPRASLFDPATNIKVAAHVYKVQGWTAWSPYKRGRCRG